MVVKGQILTGYVKNVRMDSFLLPVNAIPSSRTVLDTITSVNVQHANSDTTLPRRETATKSP